MKKSTVHIAHHEHTTPEALTKMLDNGKVGISPHIGNLDTVVNPGYLQIVMHVGGLAIELVDTIKLDDKDFHPKIVNAHHGLPKRLVNKDTGKIHLVSNKHNNRMAGSPAFKVADCVTELLLPDIVGQLSIAEFHKLSVARVAHPDSLVETSSQMVARMGGIIQPILEYASIALNRPLRAVDCNGAISIVEKFDSELPIFGFKGSHSGILAPVEVLMACEIIDAVINGHEIAHIGGNSMFFGYTRDQSVMEPVVELVRLVVEGELGESTIATYNIINKVDIASRLPKLGHGVLTQYDVIHEKIR